MRNRIFAVIALTGLLSTAAQADLDPFTDYAISDYVWHVTTVKVDSNMGDAYLEGLKQTWAAGNKVSKELGQIADWKIMRSDLPESGHFNLLLMVKFENTAAFGPSKANYDAFMAKWGAERAKESTEFAQQNYPAMRDIVGEYLMRDITLK